ncbi:MAG: LysM peptidoglycan-binding domain-containing protein [Kiritimatiellia bacterium]
MKHQNTPSFFAITSTLSLAALLLAGCATGRPPRKVGPPPSPVMPPPPSTSQRNIEKMAPLEVDFGRPTVTGTELPAAPRPPQPRRELQPREGTPYTIKKGESLSQVAARHKMNWKKLADYNYITNPDKVIVGQVILIPPGNGAPVGTESRQTATRPAPPATSGNTYVVRSGDSLSVIAQRYSTSVADLKSLNKLSSDRVLVGQILKVPDGSTPRGTPAASDVRESAPGPTPVPARPTPIPEPPRGTVNLDIGLSRPAPETAEEVEVEDPVISRAFSIVVQEGDTLESIANNYIVPVEEIRKLNKLSANAELKAGQKLLIPPGVY